LSCYVFHWEGRGVKFGLAGLFQPLFGFSELVSIAVGLKGVVFKIRLCIFLSRIVVY